MSDLNKKPWIENVSMANIISGMHFLEEGKTVLIQIQDVFTDFVTPKFKDKFKKIWQFKFMDDEDPTWDANITVKEGEEIAQILVDSLRNGDNIVVHCHAGLCRSGAVAEVGEYLGFDWAGTQKIPNLLVKNRVCFNRVVEDFLFN